MAGVNLERLTEEESKDDMTTNQRSRRGEDNNSSSDPYNQNSSWNDSQLRGDLRDQINQHNSSVRNLEVDQAQQLSPLPRNLAVQHSQQLEIPVPADNSFELVQQIQSTDVKIGDENFNLLRVKSVELSRLKNIDIGIDRLDSDDDNENEKYDHQDIFNEIN